MNSVALPSFPEFPVELSRWEPVRQIYRRICVLRATGRLDEASALQGAEFSRALAAARTAGGSGGEEAALFAAEAERVSTASLLAELIAPLLAERLRADQTVHAASNAAEPASKATPRGSPPAARPPIAAAPGIADLIDGMLAAESPFSSTHARP